MLENSFSNHSKERPKLLFSQKHGPVLFAKSFQCDMKMIRKEKSRANKPRTKMADQDKITFERPNRLDELN